MPEACLRNRAEAYRAYVLPANAVPLAVVLVQLPLENIEMRGRMVGSTARSFFKKASVQERHRGLYTGVSELGVGMTRGDG